MLAGWAFQVGILLLYASTKKFFDGEVSALSAELAIDLSFALDNADRELDRDAVVLVADEP